MNLTEIRVKLTRDPRNKLKAYCSVTFDHGFVVRDLKIIEGTGGLFVAMPSRKLADRCPHCSGKNHLRAGYCNACGGRLDPDRAQRDARGRARLHADLAHPIHRACRTELHRAIMQELEAEMQRAQESGYVPATFDDFDDFVAEDYLADLGGGATDAAPPERVSEQGG